MLSIKTKEIFDKLMKKIPKVWDGKDSIIYMKNNGCRNWKQMEWPGFYFEFLCGEILAEDNYFEIPGKKYGKVKFDGYDEFNYDFKAHSSLDDNVPTNGLKEIKEALNEYKKVGFIVAIGEPVFDDTNESFKTWHDQLKGKRSKYEIDRIIRGAPSRRRKVSFKLNSITFFFVDEHTIQSTKTFQTGMRNANGVPRNPKVLINLSDSRFEQYSYKVES